MFDQKLITSMIELGKKDAKDVIDMGRGASFDQFFKIHEFKAKESSFV